jgi:hypothetical protein
MDKAHLSHSLKEEAWKRITLNNHATAVTGI